MEVNMNIVHVGDIGDEPVKLTMNDINQNETVNMYLDNKHYRLNLKELEKMIKSLKKY